MSAFNCNTCRATFESINSVKEHYRSDLHVFNSKRRSKNLPPASAEEFDKAAAAIATKQKHVAVLPSVSKQSTGGGKHKVLNLATQPSQFAPATPEPVISTEMSLNKSNQTFDALANGNDNGMDVAEYEGEDNLTDLKHSGPDQIELPLGACVSIFDNKSFPNVESCVKHMAETNGFFIPDSDYLTDLEGLLEYLGEKVKMGSTCLYCQRRFSSGRACQHHMQQKSHCKVAYESEAAQEELEDFYDYSASYEDVSDDAEDEPAATICAVTGELILPVSNRCCSCFSICTGMLIVLFKVPTQIMTNQYRLQQPIDWLKNKSYLRPLTKFRMAVHSVTATYDCTISSTTVLRRGDLAC